MDRNNDPDRRTVLKRLGAAAATGAAVGAGATGTAAARGMSPELAAMEPRSVAATARAMPGEATTVNDVIDANAENVLALLAEDGLIDTASASALVTETVSPYTDGSVEGASAYEFGDGETRRLITVDTHVENGRIELSVEPGREVVAADFYRDDGTFVRYADLGDGARRNVDADEPCCKCCICETLFTCNDEGYAEFCYGPERFHCPFAGGGCC